MPRYLSPEWVESLENPCADAGTSLRSPSQGRCRCRLLPEEEIHRATSSQIGVQNPATVRRVTAGLAALTLSAGGAAFAGLLGVAAPTAGACSPTPTLYVANQGGTVTTFPLSTSGNVAPTAINSGSALDDPGGEALTAAGDLWVADAEGNDVSMFTPAQLDASGSPTPRPSRSAPPTAAASPWR